MAKAPKGSDTAIELPRLDTRMMEVTIIGDEPLIVHAWSKKAKLEMLGKQMKQAKGAKEAKDPVKDFQDSLYPIKGGGYGFPSVAFKAASVTACTSTGGVTKVAARQAFHIVGEGVDVEGAFPGTMMRMNLVRVSGGEPRMREDMVRVGMGTADLRYRGEFWPWFAKVLVRYNANVLSEAQILNLLNTAGFGVGVGEWRPERDGMSGMFHVATEADLKALEKASPRRRNAR
ncbi:MAG: hypothetical protein AB7P16_28680 [Bradyrhizobium sp.]|uniref:hypothetical protein n=1 Tax=Bradyrhizobium sp. TaxID=376 RepID=UPI003D09C040